MTYLCCPTCANTTIWSSVTLHEHGITAACGQCGGTTHHPTATSATGIRITGLAVGGVAVGGDSATVTSDSH